MEKTCKVKTKYKKVQIMFSEIFQIPMGNSTTAKRVYWQCWNYRLGGVIMMIEFWGHGGGIEKGSRMKSQSERTQNQKRK